MNKKLVLFGAGKIGRSFIGQLFSRGGYEVVFIDVNQQLVEELNRRGEYHVIIKGTEDQIIPVKQVRGVCAADAEAVIREVASADLAATAVGQAGLHGIFPLLASGLMQRKAEEPARVLDIIIAENLRNAAVFFREELRKRLPADYPMDDLVGLVETSIGKMVPIMTRKDVQEDPLQVFAEPYNTLILDGKAFRGDIPAIEGLAPKENMKAWVDRKLFIHNLGHAAAAYLGYVHYPQARYLYEVLNNPEILCEVRKVMQQSATCLLKKYPGEFTRDSLDKHIDDLLARFANRALGDTLFRVGCDLPRKLGPDDRVVGAIRLAIETASPFSKILKVLVCGCRFRATDENGNMLSGDIEFARIYERGIQHVLTRICRFNAVADRKIVEELILMNRRMEK